jgi:hypothetical protein
MVPDNSDQTGDVPVIPDSAVLWRGSLPAVYVATADGKTELRLIRLGEYVSGDRVAVLSGLKVGERVYATPPTGATSDWNKSPR